MDMTDELKRIKAGLTPDEWKRIRMYCIQKGISLTDYFSLPEEPKKNVDFKSVLGSEIRVTSHRRRKDGTVAGVGIGGSSFYNPQEQFNTKLRETLTAALQMQPCHTLDPKTGHAEQIAGLDLKRATAMKYIRLYYRWDKFLSSLFFQSKRRPLSLKQCDLAIQIGHERKSAEVSIQQID
jgi:hypothetical protein